MPVNSVTPSGFYVYGDYLMVVKQRKACMFLITQTPPPARREFCTGYGSRPVLPVRNDILYINNYVDLVSFNISNPTAPVMVGRTEDVVEAAIVFLPMT